MENGQGRVCHPWMYVYMHMYVSIYMLLPDLLHHLLLVTLQTGPQQPKKLCAVMGDLLS